MHIIFLRIYSIISWRNFHEYTVSHTYHHRYTLYGDGDREVGLPLEILIKKPLYLLQILTINFTGGPVTSGLIPVVKGTFETAFGGNGESVISEEWSAALYSSHPKEHKPALRWALSIIAFHLVILILAISSDLWMLPFVISLQQFTANWPRYFVGLPIHCGPRSKVNDFRKCTRYITLNPISKFLYWRMNWHFEHHMFADVPCYNLEKLRELEADYIPKVMTLIGAWREMMEVAQKQKVDPSFEFDTPVSSKKPQPSSPRILSRINRRSCIAEPEVKVKTTSAFVFFILLRI